MNADEKLKAIREIVESDELCADDMVTKVGEVLDDSPRMMPDSELNRRRMLDVIHAMDVIMRSLNDENAVDEWLQFGVPDGLNTQADIDAEYGCPEDYALESEFEDLADLFARIIKYAYGNGEGNYLAHM